MSLPEPSDLFALCAKFRRGDAADVADPVVVHW
jgi:hypothetical protein